LVAAGFPVRLADFSVDTSADPWAEHPATESDRDIYGPSGDLRAARQVRTGDLNRPFLANWYVIMLPRFRRRIGLPRREIVKSRDRAPAGQRHMEGRQLISTYIGGLKHAGPPHSPLIMLGGGICLISSIVGLAFLIAGLKTLLLPDDGLSGRQAAVSCAAGLAVTAASLFGLVAFVLLFLGS
jgi:hypothetical protein